MLIIDDYNLPRKTNDFEIVNHIGNRLITHAFHDIYVTQEALVEENDVLWAFSTSGNSTNIVKAANKAKAKGAKVIAFTGKQDSKLEQVSDICLCADTPETSTAQEIHILAYHVICDLVELDLSKKNNRSQNSLRKNI